MSFRIASSSFGGVTLQEDLKIKRLKLTIPREGSFFKSLQMAYFHNANARRMYVVYLKDELKADYAGFPSDDKRIKKSRKNSGRKIFNE